MTRRSKRELEQHLDQLQGGDAPSAPDEIVITDYVVETDHPTEAPKPVKKTRVWRDERGEWHSEEIDVDEGRDCGSKE